MDGQLADGDSRGPGSSCQQRTGLPWWERDTLKVSPSEGKIQGAGKIQRGGWREMGGSPVWPRGGLWNMGGDERPRRGIPAIPLT